MSNFTNETCTCFFLKFLSYYNTTYVFIGFKVTYIVSITSNKGNSRALQNIKVSKGTFAYTLEWIENKGKASILQISTFIS